MKCKDKCSIRCKDYFYCYSLNLLKEEIKSDNGSANIFNKKMQS